jgi:hypothetical protein
MPAQITSPWISHVISCFIMGLVFVKKNLLNDFTGVREFCRLGESYFFLMKTHGAIRPNESSFLLFFHDT